MKQIGDRIKEEREKMGYSQKELADLCAVSPGYITKIENHKTLPRVDVVQRLGLIFGSSTDYLIKGEETEPIEKVEEELRRVFENLMEDKDVTKKTIALNYLKSLDDKLKRRAEKKKKSSSE